MFLLQTSLNKFTQDDLENCFDFFSVEKRQVYLPACPYEKVKLQIFPISNTSVHQRSDLIMLIQCSKAQGKPFESIQRCPVS